MKQTRFKLVGRLLNEFCVDQSRKQLQKIPTDRIRAWVKELEKEKK